MSSMPDTRLTGLPALINHLLVWIPVVGAAGLFFWARRSGPWWAVIPGIGLLALAYWLGGRHFMTAWKAQHQADTRQAGMLLDDDSPIILRRRLRLFWPLAITLIAVFFAGLAVMIGAYAVIVVISLPLLVPAIVWWVIAARRTRPLGSVSRAGLRIGDEIFAWERVGVASDTQSRARGPRDLIVTLTGDAREFRIPLAELVGTPAVIHQVIEGHVQRGREARVRAAAEQEMRTVRERLAARPQDREMVARDIQQEMERDMREHRARMARFDAQLARLKSRSIWTAAPGALPMKQQWLIVGTFFAAVAICGFGLNADLYKSVEWSRVSAYAALVVTVVASAWALAKLLPHVRRSSRFGVALVVPFAIGGFAWLLIRNALPDVYTRLAGRPFAVEQPMRAQAVAMRSCRRRVYAPMFDEGNPSPHYCASYSEFARLPTAGLMRARGRETWFGRHVAVVEPVDPAFHAAAP